MATRIVPRNYSKRSRKNNVAQAAYLSPDMFRVITPEEMNEKLTEFISIV